MEHNEFLMFVKCSHEDIVAAGDVHFGCPMFSLEVQANFITYRQRKTFTIERSKLLSGDTSRSAVHDIFRQMNVPLRSSAVNEILHAAADEHERYKGRRVLHMSVNIDVLFAPPPLDDFNMATLYLDGNDDRDDADWNHGNGNGNGGSSSNAQTCAICLGEVWAGSEATFTPCSNLYHNQCIVKWQETSNVCPLCRTYIYQANQ